MNPPQGPTQRQGGGPDRPQRPPRLHGTAAIEAATNRTLDALAQTARKAPTTYNTQPHLLVVVRDAAKRGEIVRRAARDRGAGAMHWPMPWFAEATALVAFLVDTRRREPGQHGERTSLLGVGAAAESARIAAHATGAAWTEWRPSAAAEGDLRTMLGFPPEVQCHLVAGIVPERPSYPPPPSLSAPFAETFGNAAPVLRQGPLTPIQGDPVQALMKRTTARTHFVSATMPEPVVRTIVAGAARAGRAAGIAAPRLIFVQSPTEIGKLADVMFDIASALYKDADYSRALATWQSFDESEWQARGDGLLVLGKAAPKLLRAQAKGLWNRLTSALGGNPVDDMVKESMSEMVREAPLVIAWAIPRESDRRAWAAGVIDAGASMMRVLYDAERLGLGSQGFPVMLEDLPGRKGEVAAGEQRVKELLQVPADHYVVNAARVGKLDTEDTPPAVTWRGDVRRPLEKMVFQERYSGS